MSKQEVNDELDTFDDEFEEEEEEEVSHDDPPTKPKSMNNGQDRATQLEATVNQLLADPDIQAVIRARQAGKRVTVAEVEAAQEKIEEELDEFADLDPEDPSTKVLKRLIQAVDKRLDRKVGRLSEELTPIKGFMENFQAKEVETQVKSARAKYADLDEYKGKMLELSKENPTLGVEELYILARMRSGKLNMRKPSTETEKPTQQPRSRPQGEGRRKAESTPAGRKGFTELLGKALDNIDFGSME